MGQGGRLRRAPWKGKVGTGEKMTDGMDGWVDGREEAQEDSWLGASQLCRILKSCLQRRSAGSSVWLWVGGQWGHSISFTSLPKDLSVQPSVAPFFPRGGRSTSVACGIEKQKLGLAGVHVHSMDVWGTRSKHRQTLGCSHIPSLCLSRFKHKLWHSLCLGFFFSPSS